MTTTDSDNSEFRLSRVYAQGWNAARALLKSGTDAGDAATLNPYRTGSERARWHEGFTKALE